MKKILTKMFVLMSLFTLSLSSAHARILPGLVDSDGNAVHTADEFELGIVLNVNPDPQGYRYTYSISNNGASNQAVWMFRFFFQDANSVVLGSATTPWGEPTYPKARTTNKAFTSFFACDPDLINPPPLTAGNTLVYTFVSPYPPGIIQAYAEGVTNSPWFADVPIDGVPEYSENTPFGPGKIVPVIGPVKPAVAAGGVASPYNNVTVQGCTGNSCTVQINATGPMDPYGTAYTYTWSGPFGSASGANPTIQLPPGTTPVTLSVTDANGTVLTTATMDVVVVDPNPKPLGGGNGGVTGGDKGKHHEHGKDNEHDGGDHDKKKSHDKRDKKDYHDD